ncbi:MAG: hypothetical protein QOD58_3987 [Mycobacterium sp.]|nr:hypothetical protein [Mycobacterium sp.]
MTQPNEKMPLLPELSEAVKHNIEARYNRTISGADTPLANDFEQWLSYLVEFPPWLSEADQARNRADFLDVSLAVHQELIRCQRTTVMRVPCPDWLRRVVRYWEDQAATVITFNYDQLVELAWFIFANDHENVSNKLYPVPLAPIGSRIGNLTVDGGTASGSRPRPSLRLLKLHGSVNWWYSRPESPAGGPVYDADLDGSEWGVNGIRSLDHADIDLATIDLQPMIVPPTAVKSPYYANSLLKSLWTLAGEALKEADELVMMGFSLPITDMLVSSMLCTQLHPSARITPVNRSRGIIDRVCTTFGIDETSERIDNRFAGLGSDAIATWVDTFVN